MDLSKAPSAVKVIKLIDRIDNLRDIEVMDKDFALRYLEESRDLLSIIKCQDEILNRRLSELINQKEL